jgi:GWxTD domain-containing protein
MKPLYYYVSFILLILCPVSYGQNNYAVPQNYSGYGENNSSNGYAKTPEEYLRGTIKTNPDPELLFELAKICTGKNTISGRTEARELLIKAIVKAPKKLDYRFLLAEILEKISTGLAYKVYKDILEIDSTSPKALYNLGVLEESEFNDYHNSVSKDGDQPSLSFEKFANDDFLAAVNFLTAAIKYDSLNHDAYLHLSYLYEDDGEPEKGLVILKRISQIFPFDNDVHLYLGLLYYETSKIENSLKEFQQALLLMPDSIKEDFTYNSVKELIKPIFGEKFENLPKNEIKELINIFWSITDPLYITDYNERLLEHYSRVAYANLRFNLIDKDVPGNHVKMAGWKTDKGEMILRYGVPQKQLRFRPYISAGGGTAIEMKTDVWYYKNFTVGFTDQYWNNNFVYSEIIPGSRFNPQFAGDSQMLANYLRKVEYQIYTPKFEGPKIDVPYNIAQFRNAKYNYTDVYVNYALYAADSLKSADKYYYRHEWGLFFFDTTYNSIVKEKGNVEDISSERKINIAADKNLLISSLMMSIYPQSGNLAFEIERQIDKGVFTDHSYFSPRKFKTNELDISDVILASALKRDTLNALPLKRQNMSILPNPLNKFYSANPIYIYYELYNLNKDKSGFTSIEQKLMLKKRLQSSGISSTLNSVLSVVGLGKQKEEVTVFTNYQMRETDPQIGFQIDMHNYQPGEYIITLVITDNLSGKQINKEVSLVLQ